MSVQALLALLASGELSTVSRREAAMRAAKAVLSSINGLTVLRPPEGAQDVSAAPYCVLTADGPEEQDPTLGFVRRHWDLRVRCMFFVERRTSADAAQAALDALGQSAAAAFEADRQLGGVIDDLMVEPLDDMSEDAPEGANEGLSASLPLTLFYTTGRNPEETYS